MVEQIARQLAEELVKSEYGQAFIAAKQAYDKDLDAQHTVSYTHLDVYKRQGLP